MLMKKEKKKLFFLKKTYKRTWGGIDKNTKVIDISRTQQAIHKYLENKGYGEFTYKVSVSLVEYFLEDMGDKRFRIYFRVNIPTYERPFRTKTTFIQADKDGYIEEEKLLSRMKEVVEGKELFQKIMKENEREEREEKIFLEKINKSLKDKGYDIKLTKNRWHSFGFDCYKTELEKMISKLKT